MGVIYKFIESYSTKFKNFLWLQLFLRVLYKRTFLHYSLSYSVTWFPLSVLTRQGLGWNVKLSSMGQIGNFISSFTTKSRVVYILTTPWLSSPNSVNFQNLFLNSLARFTKIGSRVADHFIHSMHSLDRIIPQDFFQRSLVVS